MPRRRINNKRSKQPTLAKRTRKPRRTRGRAELGNPSNKLIPAGINNRATMPPTTESYTFHGEEVIKIINAPAEATAGTILANERVSVSSARRLNLMAQAFQRVKWHKAELHLVALNGTLATSGYNAGFAEDPELTVPINPSDVIPFLTSMRSTVARQNWVESSTGRILKLSELPEMFTTLGSDPRRYYIGRFLAAYTGNPGPNVTFQLLLKYHVTLSVPIAKAVADDLNEFIITQDVNVGSCGIANTPGAPTNLRPLTTEIASTTVSSVSALPPQGTWQLDEAAGGYFRLQAFTHALTTDDDTWELHNKIKESVVFDEIHQIFVPPGATNWSQVTYRTQTGNFRAWPSGRIFARRRGEAPDYDTIDFSVASNAFLPTFATDPAWAGDLSFPGKMPGNWPQQPIMHGGSVLRKVVSLSLEDQLTEMQSRIIQLSLKNSV